MSLGGVILANLVLIGIAASIVMFCIRRRSATWSPLEAVVITLSIYFVSQLIAVALLSIYPIVLGWTEAEANRWFESSIYAQFGATLLIDAATLGLIYLFLRLRHIKWSALGVKKPQVLDVPYITGGYIAYFILYAITLGLITKYVTSIDVEQQQELGFNTFIGGQDLIFVFVALVILPPMIEELLCRGFLFSGLRNKFKPLLAGALTCVIFGIAHLQLGSGNPPLWIAAIDTFILSIVLVYVRIKTDSLVAPIGIHMIKNGMAFLSLFIFHLP